MRRWDTDAYDRRWTDLAAGGAAVHGEADLVCAYEPRSVLDGGCGTGRVAIELARRGIEVVGVDVTDEMIRAARAKAPDIAWHHADLATIVLGRRFDVVVLAGNVLLFVDPGTEAAVIERCADHLAVGGRLVAGFQIHPGGYDLTALDRHATLGGLVLEDRFATWERAPFDGGSYAVSAYRRET